MNVAGVDAVTCVSLERLRQRGVVGVACRLV
jgi:hypothetical protein